MKWAFSFVRVFDIDIKIHATFGLILLLGAIQWGGPNGLAGAAFGVLLMMLLFLCVVLHELGHSLVAKAFGLPVREIVLLPIGGVAQLEKNPQKPAHELLISIAGPMVNVVIAAVLIAFAGVSGSFEGLNARGLVTGLPAAPSAATMLAWLIAANVTLALFNMIPAFPMDGGRVVRAIFWFFLGFSKATRIASGIGQFLALVIGLWSIVNGHLLLTLIAAFIFLGAGQEWAAERARAVLTTLRVGDAYNKHALTLSPADRVSTVVNLLLTSYQPDFAVVQGNSLAGVVTREHVLKALLSNTDDQYVTAIMDRDIPQFQASAELDTIRNEMAANGKQVGAIFDGDKYLGLVSQEDIKEALLISTFAAQQEKRRLAQAGAA
ncbi:MAG: site-2 protease family protein [Acidobacteria bacterium]|nr:site-2 protease family protein [Acidobacteriota bacterium]